MSGILVRAVGFIREDKVLHTRIFSSDAASSVKIFSSGVKYLDKILSDAALKHKTFSGERTSNPAPSLPPRRHSSSFPGRPMRVTGLLIREVKQLHYRSFSSDAASKFKRFGFSLLNPDYDFGHPPFGIDYGIDVPLGEDGLPLWVDWSLVPGAVCPAKDQEESDICFVIPTVLAVGSLDFLKTGNTEPLSIQQVIDCMPGLALKGGGSPMEVLDFILKNGGLVRESAYPYTGVKGLCQSPEGPRVTFDAWRRVVPNDMYALKYCVAHQPVIVDLCFTDSVRVIGSGDEARLVPLLSGDEALSSYESGVMIGPSGLSNHNMLSIGYGDPCVDGIPQAWWCLNSYSVGWGHQGKCWIEMSNDKDGGALGILTNPHLPIIWTGEEEWFL